MNLFISYCHEDELYISKFIKVLKPITGTGKLVGDIWYDRGIKVGENLWNKIDTHLNNGDVICLFLSVDYLASPSCMKEMHKTLERRKSKCILVIPIILKPCAWQDASEELSSILAVPQDGKAVSLFNNEDEAWMDIYLNIKQSIVKQKRIQDLTFKSEFAGFLNDASPFTKSNPNKNSLYLNDIFVYPDMKKVEKDGEMSQKSAKSLIENFKEGDGLVIIGEDQSGKTSLLKKFVECLRKRNFLPIYVKDPAELLQGNISYRISTLFKQQYESEFDLSEFDQNKIVPVVDDFHKAKNKEKVLKQILKFKNYIVVVDDIFALDTRSNVLPDIPRYEIMQLLPSQRNELIQKWLRASEIFAEGKTLSNGELQEIDTASNLIEDTLGRIIGKRIMPAYAYFILLMLVVSNNADKPVDENITSQGYCYQALIVLFLKKRNVSNADMDSYINFLTEFANKIYYNHGQALSSSQFEDFVEDYKKVYNFTDSLNIMLKKLDDSNIMRKTELGNYKFNYPYIYYFFAGKYFAQVWEDRGDPNHEKTKAEIEKILLNLHKTSNAYIAVFIAHHTKNSELLGRMKSIAQDIYKNSTPAAYDKNSLSVFSGVERYIAVPSLPAKSTPIRNRQTELEHKDKDEVEVQLDLKHENPDSEPDETNEVAKELRRSFRTVEVIGSIIKNRAGSLRNNQLETLFEEAMDVLLRLTTNFLALVKVIVDSDDGLNLLEESYKDVHPDIDESQISIRVKNLFWAMNFCFLFGVIKKLAFMLGSPSIVKIARSVCERRGTPASFILKHTIIMWFKKNIDISELQKMDRYIDNKTAKHVMLWIVSDYCRVHVVGYKESEKLMKLGLKKQIFSPSPNKEKKK